MSKTIVLNDVEEIATIIGSKAVKLGFGAEGVAYLSSKDNKVYKIISEMFLEEDIQKVITSDDLNLNCFVFPEQLYVYKNRLLAYKTRYIDKDLFKISNKDNIYSINFDKLVIAYKRMLEEVKILSENSIKIFDLTFNLMFDGENLYAIDTCGYKKVEDDINELYQYNKNYLECAVKTVLSAYLMNKVDEDTYDQIDKIDVLEERIEEIKNTIKR